MRFEVPQFIEIEDKIVGPLTWRQFVYIAGGVGILVIMYLSLPFLFTIILGLPLGALAVSLAFHKINNRPFSMFLESSISYFSKNKLYLWRKEEAQSIIEKTDVRAPSAPTLGFTSKKSISSLSRRLELQVPEQQ